MRIGEIAGLVGISTRAIRHYHRVGLLAEPARKANGYREYSLRDAVELARVRRLTELGLAGACLSRAGRAVRPHGPCRCEPGPEPAMAAKDRDLLALLETVAPARGTDWLGVLTRTLNSDPGAVERAYGVYACLDELAGSPADDPRVEATAQAIVAAIPGRRGRRSGFPTAASRKRMKVSPRPSTRTSPRPRPPRSAGPSA